MEIEDVNFLKQIVKSLEEAEKNLKQSYENKDSEKFNQSKKIIIKLQKEISEIIK